MRERAPSHGNRRDYHRKGKGRTREKGFDVFKKRNEDESIVARERDEAEQLNPTKEQSRLGARRKPGNKGGLDEAATERRKKNE